MLPRGSIRPVSKSAFNKRPPIKIPGAKCKSLAKPYPWILGGYGSQPSVRDRSQRRLRRVALAPNTCSQLSRRPAKRSRSLRVH